MIQAIFMPAGEVGSEHDLEQHPDHENVERKDEGRDQPSPIGVTKHVHPCYVPSLSV